MGKRAFAWDRAHERGDVPLDVTRDTVCDARRGDSGRVERGACEEGVTIVYDAPEGPKVRHVRLDAPGVAEAIDRFERAKRADACSCKGAPPTPPPPRSPRGRPPPPPGMPPNYIAERAKDATQPLGLSKTEGKRS